MAPPELSLPANYEDPKRKLRLSQRRQARRPVGIVAPLTGGCDACSQADSGGQRVFATLTGAIVLRRQALMKWQSIVLVCVLMGTREAHSQMVELTTTGMVRGTFLSRVRDGNTVDLFTGTSPWPSFTIRLARIDAPELDQPYGYEARQHLGDLLQEEYILSCSAREAD